MPTVYTWSTALRPAMVDWGLFVPQVAVSSTFDGSAQAATIGAPRWWFEIETGALKLAEVPQWEAHIDRLRARVNRVRAWDWRREAPLGVATGTPLVRLAASGATMETKGWTPSVTGILLAGSYLGVNGELKRLSADMNSNASGFATATFEPPLRFTAAVDSVITLVKPTAKFMLVSERPSMRQQGARNPGATYRFEEDLAP